MRPERLCLRACRPLGSQPMSRLFHAPLQPCLDTWPRTCVGPITRAGRALSLHSGACLRTLQRFHVRGLRSCSAPEFARCREVIKALHGAGGSRWGGSIARSQPSVEQAPAGGGSHSADAADSATAGRRGRFREPGDRWPRIGRAQLLRGQSRRMSPRFALDGGSVQRTPHIGEAEVGRGHPKACCAGYQRGESVARSHGRPRALDLDGVKLHRQNAPTEAGAMLDWR